MAGSLCGAHITMAVASLLLLLLLLGTTLASAGRSELEVAAEVERLRAEYHWPTGTEALGAEGTIQDQDCAVSILAYEYSLQLQPQLAPLLEVFDALELGTVCKQPRPAEKTFAPPTFAPPAGALHVDGAKGSDSASGTAAAPLKTVGAALKLCGAEGTKAIVLRAGVHYLDATLEVSAALSGLVVQNYPGEAAWISGGVPLTASWAAGEGGVYSAKTPQLATVPGLNRLDATDPLHARMTRARWPNKVPDTTMEHGLAPTVGTTWLKPPGWGQPGYNVSRSETYLPAAGEEPGGPEAAGSCGEAFTYGVGGTMCERYTPAGGFWCSNASTGGGSGWELMVPGAPLFPVGLMLDADFTAEGPMGAAGVPPPSTWKNKTGAVVETWTNGWSTTFWEVTDITKAGSGGNTTFVFGGAGGQQSGRGFHIDPPSDGPNHGPIQTEVCKHNRQLQTRSSRQIVK
jgi:hypothetical protein